MSYPKYQRVEKEIKVVCNGETKYFNSFTEVAEFLDVRQSSITGYLKVMEKLKGGSIELLKWDRPYLSDPWR